MCRQGHIAARLLLTNRLSVEASCSSSVLHPHTLADAAYGRTGYTLISRSSSALAEAAANLAREACALLDIRQHRATHPRRGRPWALMGHRQELP